MTAYWVTLVRSLDDPEALARYVRLAGPAIADGGGRYLARGPAVAAFENGIEERTVVIEFESVETALATYRSPQYQRALAQLGDTAVRDVRIVPGVE